MPKLLSFHGLAFSILKMWPAKVYPWSEKTRETLMKADIEISYVVYISSMFFWTVFGGILGLVVSLLTVNILFPLLGFYYPESLRLLIVVSSTILLSGSIFFFFYIYPFYSVGEKKRELEKNLVYVVNYMHILSSAGATPEDVFVSLAKSGDLYGMAKNARSIIRDVEILGTDILTSIDNASKRSPSQDYTDLLQGYISTITTGGDVASFLLTMADQFMEARKRQLEKIIGQLGLAGELFVGVLVAFPVMMIVILSIMGLMGGGTALGGLEPSQLMMIMTYIMIPLIAIAVLIYVDGVLASW